MKKLEFQIGQSVHVADVAKRVTRKHDTIRWVPHNLWVLEKREEGLRWLKQIAPFIGVVVGATYKQEGRIVGGSWDEPNHFEQTRKVLLWKVATSYLGLPHLVFAEDMVAHGYGGGGRWGARLPWSPSSLFWNKQTREDLSKDMKQLYQEQPGLFPRDEKGRFCKSD